MLGNQDYADISLPVYPLTSHRASRLKPTNILVGVETRANVVYVIDFGLSKQFRSSETHLHITLRGGRGLTGTSTFASINRLAWRLEDEMISNPLRTSSYTSFAEVYLGRT